MYGVNKSRVQLPPLTGNFKPIRRQRGYHVTGKQIGPAHRTRFAPLSARQPTKAKVVPQCHTTRVVPLSLPPIDGPVSIDYLRRQGWTMPRPEMVPKLDRAQRETQKDQIRSHLFHPRLPTLPTLPTITFSEPKPDRLPLPKTPSRRSVTFRGPPACANSGDNLARDKYLINKDRVIKDMEATDRRRKSLSAVQLKASEMAIRSLRKSTNESDYPELTEEETDALADKIQQRLRKESIAERRRLSEKHDAIAQRLKYQRSKSLSIPPEVSDKLNTALSTLDEGSNDRASESKWLNIIDEGRSASNSSASSGSSSSGDWSSGYPGEYSSTYITQDYSDETVYSVP